MKLATRIKTVRGNHNLTQGELAEKLQVSRSTISSWETGRSYPDLQMIIQISDQFDVSLDYLLREDEKMVKKLNFGAKQKKWLIGSVITLSLLVGNMILSNVPIEVKSESVDVNDIVLIRDMSYTGDDMNRDWNTTIDFMMQSKNPFFKPINDELLVFNNEGNLVLEMKGTYSLFHLFDTQRNVNAHQSVLIPADIQSDDIQVFVEKIDNDSLPYHISEVNS